MKREIETKFFTFRQNNSGGYFVRDEKYGVCEYVIIEAIDAESAWSKLKDDDDGTEIPMIYDHDVKNIKKDAFTEKCFIHYIDDTIEKIVFKDS